MKVIKEAISPAVMPIEELPRRAFFLLGGSLFQRTAATMCNSSDISCITFPEGGRTALPPQTIVQQVEIEILVTEIEAE